MSIEYTLHEDDDQSKPIILTVSLSNGTLAAWQDEVGLYRTVRMNDTGEIQRRSFHTTIHDDHRLSFEVDYLEHYFDNLGDDEPLSPLLTKLIQKAEEHGCNYVFV